MSKNRKIKALQANESEFSIEIEATFGLEKLLLILSERCSIPSERIRIWHSGREIFDQNDFDRIKSNEMTLLLSDRGKPAVEADRPIRPAPQRPVVADKFLFIWCLLANIEGENSFFAQELIPILECVRCLKLEKPNRQAKIRIDKAPEWTIFSNRANLKAVPLVTDFACFCERLGKAFKDMHEETIKNVELLKSGDSDCTPNQFLLRFVISFFSLF